jgi:septal ring factor EnvC (AmiA/AmiB activator)
MNIILIAAIFVVFLISILLTYFITSRNANLKIKGYKSIEKAILDATEKLSKVTNKLNKSKIELAQIDAETKELQELKTNANKISFKLRENTEKLNLITSEIEVMEKDARIKRQITQDIIAKLDLYTRVEEFVEYGLFEFPEYLHETSARFIEEIKRIREQQKELIKSKSAVIYPESTVVSSNGAHNKKILDGQVQLMLTAFNVECDALIAKVSPSSFSRTLERIESLANKLEKGAASLHCGFNLEYVELKYKECQLQYQNKLKKQEEQDEQRLIREQIREEQKAIKEYERAINQAEKEERMYRELLEKARAELNKVSEADRIITEQKISELERQLAEAEAKEERAKSLAQQTRKGHVYVISNIGSFGENIYKIGLTRRLEPLDRVKELGDASVPFLFDVHAMIYVEDAPALESALHRKFIAKRVNAVNMRKEFFNTDLLSIKEAVEEIVGLDAEFQMTSIAEEYYESRRLRGQNDFNSEKIAENV